MIPVRTDLPPVAVLNVRRLRAGAVVRHNGVEKTVEGVILRGFNLHLKLHGQDVHEDDVEAVVERLPVYRRDHSYWKTAQPALD